MKKKNRLWRKYFHKQTHYFLQLMEGKKNPLSLFQCKVGNLYIVDLIVLNGYFFSLFSHHLAKSSCYWMGDFHSKDCLKKTSLPSDEMRWGYLKEICDWGLIIDLSNCCQQMGLLSGAVHQVLINLLRLRGQQVGSSFLKWTWLKRMFEQNPSSFLSHLDLSFLQHQPSCNEENPKYLWNTWYLNLTLSLPFASSFSWDFIFCWILGLLRDSKLSK